MDFSDFTMSQNSNEFEMDGLKDSASFPDNFTIALTVTIQENCIADIIGLSPALKVLFAILLLMLETLGNMLLICMILYEKYGMDPQKRTIANQLLSRMLIVQIVCNIFILPIYAFIGIFGLHSK